MNKQMLITVLLVVPLLLLLNACVPTFRTPDTPTQIPSSALTNTTRPTEQETTTFSPTSKPTLTLTASNTANTAVSKMPSPTPDPYDKILLSPDGRYVAKLYSEYNYITGRPTIEVLDNSGSLLWTIPYQRVMPTGDPHPYLRMHEWSSDSLTLYFYYAFHYDGVYTLWDGFDLQSIQVTTGRIQHIVPGAGLMAFAFSPNEQYVAYTRNQDQPRCLIVRNLANGGESK
ncbi:MAG: hypothetical protein JXA78_19970, partial [Anaerolineales bacterium]|nr:hypothetical protein [Anaerolineales bacterium]